MCSDGRVKYESSGGRMSGDPNTSLGNILICLSGHVLYSRTSGVRTVILNDGDDSVILMERADLARYTGGLGAFWLKLGFRIGVDSITDVFERIDFCQCRPVKVDGVWTMIRNPAVAIQKDLTSATPFASAKERKSWFSAVGTGGLSQYAGVPIFDAFYTALQKQGTADATNYQWRAGLKNQAAYRVTGHRGTAGKVGAETRASFYMAFGVTPDEQLEAERACANHQFASDNPGDKVDLKPYHKTTIPTTFLKGRSFGYL
jgi:hypothetical protein